MWSKHYLLLYNFDHKCVISAYIANDEYSTPNHLKHTNSALSSVSNQKWKLSLLIDKDSLSQCIQYKARTSLHPGAKSAWRLWPAFLLCQSRLHSKKWPLKYVRVLSPQLAFCFISTSFQSRTLSPPRPLYPSEQLFEMSNVTYPLTPVLWPDEGFIQVYASDSTRIALISIQFLRSGGVLTWDYVHFAVSCCINETSFVLEPQEKYSPGIDFDATPIPCSLLCKLESRSYYFFHLFVFSPFSFKALIWH